MDTAEVINLVILELSRARLSIKKVKVCVIHANQRQKICGLIVNKRLSLSSDLKKQLLSDVANNRISKASLNGWLSNLKVIDLKYREKLKEYAITKGLLSA